MGRLLSRYRTLAFAPDSGLPPRAVRLANDPRRGPRRPADWSVSHTGRSWALAATSGTSARRRSRRCRPIRRTPREYDADRADILPVDPCSVLQEDGTQSFQRCKNDRRSGGRDRVSTPAQVGARLSKNDALAAHHGAGAFAACDYAGAPSTPLGDDALVCALLRRVGGLASASFGPSCREPATNLAVALSVPNCWDAEQVRTLARRPSVDPAFRGGESERTRRGAAAAAAWIFRGSR